MRMKVRVYLRKWFVFFLSSIFTSGGRITACLNPTVFMAVPRHHAIRPIVGLVISVTIFHDYNYLFINQLTLRKVRNDANPAKWVVLRFYLDPQNNLVTIAIIFTIILRGTLFNKC